MDDKLLESTLFDEDDWLDDSLEEWDELFPEDPDPLDASWDL